MFFVELIEDLEAEAFPKPRWASDNHWNGQCPSRDEARSSGVKNKRRETVSRLRGDGVAALPGSGFAFGGLAVALLAVWRSWCRSQAGVYFLPECVGLAIRQSRVSVGREVSAEACARSSTGRKPACAAIGLAATLTSSSNSKPLRHHHPNRCCRRRSPGGRIRPGEPRLNHP